MVNLRGSPEPLIKLIAHLIRHEGRPTKRARLLIMVHPTVQTRPVKNVLAIRQTPDLLLDLKLVQANGAVFRSVSGRSRNLITGRNSRIRRADTGGFSGIRVLVSGQTTSVSRNSERPRK
ncbi:hypothetical protein Pyn_03120 [Prunus yedoensis var. nudiflora]|uniref:Uncharacterized protein n=1 Tax=Prunus yedoensis var. nudiflora TaxID=2094558 RepID=A0A314UI97_PRUYE|nr:hypothetical protein Pyn_03120 [Prunus yedoensis var. nudiflora]